VEERCAALRAVLPLRERRRVHAFDHRGRVIGELVELRIDEPRLERRHDDEVRDSERPADDRQEREREPESNARDHVSGP
jgi:hypothetical protein